MDFIEKQASKYPEVSGEYSKLGELYEKRLWHQLTDSMVDFVSTPANRKNGGQNLIDLYSEFMSFFESKVNQLKFVQIMAVIAQQHLSEDGNSTNIKEYESAIAFLTKITDKRGRLGDGAYVVARMAVAELYTRMAAVQQANDPSKVEGTLKKAKEIFEETKPIVQVLEGTGTETVVNSSFHRVSAEYYKVKGPADEFYKSALQFLAYTPEDTLDVNTRRNLAIDMSLSALIGETVFNFGEVLSQPILSVLDDTDYAWVHQVLKAYSAGDIDRFNQVYESNKAQFDAQPALVANMELLRQKLALLSLMQLVFIRPPEERTISFETVAEATKLEVDQVEWLLMRAMSKELIKGTIDQIEGSVHVSWLKPRVLEKSQFGLLHHKLSKWSGNVMDTLGFIEAETPEMFE